MIGARRIVLLTLLLNVALCVAHFVVWYGNRSELVLAQGADSFMDIAVGIVLLISVKVGAQPRDANHPFGHQRAEPIGALVTAVLAGVVAFEVGRSAVAALLVHEKPSDDLAVLGVLGGKFVVKLLLLIGLVLVGRARGSQAVAATRLDTLNDVLTTGSSLIGALLVRRGYSSADAALALPVAAYIARNGFVLARGSLRYLMGEAPSAEVHAELERAAAAVPGVLALRRLRAHFVGSVLHVEVVILIAPGSSAKRGHDIALDVQRAVESHELVGEVFVHIDTGEGKDGT